MGKPNPSRVNIGKVGDISLYCEPSAHDGFRLLRAQLTSSQGFRIYSSPVSLLATEVKQSPNSGRHIVLYSITEGHGVDILHSIPISFMQVHPLVGDYATKQEAEKEAQDWVIDVGNRALADLQHMAYSRGRAG